MFDERTANYFIVSLKNIAFAPWGGDTVEEKKQEIFRCHLLGNGRRRLLTDYLIAATFSASLSLSGSMSCTQVVV